ncbi:hypothetical protein BGZ75_005697 [Mortierella antarctica]|nr:hypothetical protein BGZ75_005697 [Mortierella antarctica]
MPVPLQSSRPSGSSSTSSPLLSSLDAKAESTAKAMTKRYAAKNLNMTETEAHRMVQVMAAEIVALHEEREAMLQKMQLAKEEMLEAARLLRMKADLAAGEREREVTAADASSGEAKEMQDMSMSMPRSTEKAGDGSDEDEQMVTLEGIGVVIAGRVGGAALEEPQTAVAIVADKAVEVLGPLLYNHLHSPNPILKLVVQIYALHHLTVKCP